MSEEEWNKQRILSAAFALADSGKYPDFAEIEYALRFERGWMQAGAMFEEHALRATLNARCADARDTEASTPASAEVAPVEAGEIPVTRAAHAVRDGWFSRLTRWGSAGDLKSAG
jgi:hypothetical protein